MRCILHCSDRQENPIRVAPGAVAFLRCYRTILYKSFLVEENQGPMRPTPPTGPYILVLLVCLAFGADAFAQSAPLPTWSGSFNYQGTYSYTMVGTNPTGGNSTTIPVYLIPLKITIGSVVYDPSTVLNSVLASPIFCTPPQGRTHAR
jgi:hypothetical protein